MLKKFINLKSIFKTILNRRIENILSVFTIFFFLILLFAQIGLVNNKTRAILSSIDVFEGYRIDEVDSIIREGTVTLELIDIKKESDIKILVNGLEVDKFYKKSIDVVVRNNAIIEIDGTRIKSPIRVRISGKTDNIIGNIVNKEITVQSNIKIITSIKLK